MHTREFQAKVLPSQITSSGSKVTTEAQVRKYLGLSLCYIGGMKDRYQFAVDLAKEAGERILIAREKPVDVGTKNNDSRDILTNVDIEISNFISGRIRETFSNEAIYSEEATDEDISSGSFWAIDPVDGTASFSRNIPHFSVVIAYVDKGVPAVGAIYNPVTREMFSFEKDRGAFLDDKLIKVSEITDLSKGHIFLRAGRKPELWDWGANAYRFLLEHANKSANFGSSALDMCFVAAGRIEASLYGNLTTIDIAAALGVLREAGGILVGKDGKEVWTLSREKQSIMAVNNESIKTALLSGIKF